MSPIKIGDKVKCINLGKKGSGWVEGKEFIVSSITKDSLNNLSIFWPSGGGSGIYENSVTLLNNIKKMGLIEKFRTATKSEPEKSFIKKGITDVGGVLTTEGKEMFLMYLLEKNKEDFNTEIVSKIELLKEE